MVGLPFIEKSSRVLEASPGARIWRVGFLANVLKSCLDDSPDLGVGQQINYRTLPKRGTYVFTQHFV